MPMITTMPQAWSAPVTLTADEVWQVRGGPPSSPATGYAGPVGRCISVVIDPAFSPTNLEPAVLEARRTLAKQYGVTLP